MINQELLYKFFSGQTNANENQAVDEWKLQSKENLAEFRQVERLFSLTDLLQDMEKIDANSARKNVEKRLSKEYGLRTLWDYWQKIAAIIMLPLILSVVYFYTNQNIKNNVVQSEFTSPPGMRSKFVLPDSTQVWLNAGSTIIFPSDFGEQTRSLSLLGEAYFDVSKDKNLPFLVNTSKICTRVYGTRFNISFYPDDNTIETSLVSGSVSICKSNNIDKTIAKLEPGERAIFDKNKNNLVVEAVDIKKHVAWQQDKLVFFNDSLSVVLKKLGRWFNVEFEIADKELLGYQYTATFEDESLLQILKLLKYSAPINFTYPERVILDNSTYSKRKIMIRKMK